MQHSFKNTLSLLLLLCLVQAPTLRAQHTAVAESAVTSAVLKKKVKYLVRLPERYYSAKQRYPLLFCLQGNAQTLDAIAAIAQKAHQDGSCSDMIVVGIDSDEGMDRMSTAAKYDRFLSFLEKELMPAIRKKYRTTGQTILYEKSLSGSFALYTLLAKPALFNGYIAASKQWYDENNDYFTRLADKALQKPQLFKGKTILMASLNGAYNNNNIAEVNEQMAAFAKRLETRSNGGITARHEAFDDWGISPQPGLQAGLQFVCAQQTAAPGKASKLTMQQSSDGKWVILDSQKTIFYDVFIYDNGPDYPSEGLIRVVQNGKIGYADATTYTLVIAPQFDCAYPFENGKAKVSKACQTVKDGEHSIWKSDHWQFVDKKGQVSN